MVVALVAFPEQLFFSPRSQTKHEILQNSAGRHHQSQAGIENLSMHQISIQQTCLAKWDEN